jgi:RNA polymerase sigma factor (sigma-70 family)
VGDDERLAALFVRYRDRLWTMIAQEAGRWGLPESEIDDIAGHVMLVVTEQWRRGHGPEIADAHWPPRLRTIAKNEIRNVARRHRKHRHEPLPVDIPHPRGNDYGPVLDRMTEPAMRAAIDMLGEPERSTLLLMIYERLTPTEAADKTGLDPRTAQRIVRNLAAKLSSAQTGGTVKGPKAEGVRRLARWCASLRDGGSSGE